MRRAPLLVVVVVLSAGCASAPSGPTAPGAVEQTSLDFPRKAAKAPPTPDGGPEPLMGDPYAKRAGGQERGDKTPPTKVAFEAPSAVERTPVARGGALVTPARLAVVFVRDGALHHDGAALLELAALLSKDTDLQTIVRLGDPGATSASLATLAKAAKAEHRDLLLVDLRSSQGAARESYLLTTDGVLVARYERGGDEDAMRIDQRGSEALITRIGRALARLKP